MKNNIIKGVFMFTPGWIFDISVARTASEYLSSEIGIEAFAKKYAEGLASYYKNAIEVEVFSDTAETILEFLSEIEAGDRAVEFLNDFTYFRLYYENNSTPRKMKPLFGSIEDGEKLQEYKPEETIKAFRAYIFGMRSNAVPTAPDGWRLETDNNIDKFKLIIERQVSMLDMF